MAYNRVRLINGILRYIHFLKGYQRYSTFVYTNPLNSLIICFANIPQMTKDRISKSIEMSNISPKMSLFQLYSKYSTKVVICYKNTVMGVK